jgi:hypothetical protein
VVEAVSGIVVCRFKGTWSHWNLTSGCVANVCPSCTLDTICLVCSSPHVDAERGCVCGACLGDLFELGGGNAQEIQLVCRRIDRDRELLPRPNGRYAPHAAPKISAAPTMAPRLLLQTSSPAENERSELNQELSFGWVPNGGHFSSNVGKTNGLSATLLWSLTRFDGHGRPSSTTRALSRRSA